jgi:hypothetical protein
MKNKGLCVVFALGAGTLALVSCASLPPPSSATSVPPASRPSCAWPSVYGVQTSNTTIPDSGAAYWAQLIVAGESTRITVSGTYPDARYFSLSVYTPYGAPFTIDGVSSSLDDYQIAPRPGSVNPWRHRAAPGGRYEVTIRPTVTPGRTDALAFPPGTSTSHPGYLFYRVYLPAGGSFSSVRPPTITLTQGRASHTLPTCRTHVPMQLPEKPPAGTAPAATGTPPLANAFFKVALTKYESALANADSAYALAYIVRPLRTDVVVVTAKAPTFTPGSNPLPWPQASVEMRYWSMCIGVGAGSLPTVVNRLPGGQTDYGCRADDQTKLADGYYAYVIGSETQRAAISRIAGATFLPFSTTQTAKVYLLLLRNMLVNPSFTHAVQNITRASEAPAASAAMGPYYPKISTCALSALIAKGLIACEAR